MEYLAAAVFVAFIYVIVEINVQDRKRRKSMTKAEREADDRQTWDDSIW